MNTVKEKVVLLCKKRGISVRKLEIDLGFGNGTINKWGKTQPRIDKLKAVADYFGINVSDLAVYNDIEPGGKTEPDFNDVQFAFLNGFDDLPDDEKKRRFVEIVGKLSEMMKNESE